MQGPEWNSTAIFLAWDDWGGFYDHVVPPKIDENGYGLRVPGLVISPYAKTGYIDHQTLSFDAYLKFIEDDFLNSQRIDPQTDGRPDPRPTRSGERPAKLGDLVSDFDFTQTPRQPLVLKVTGPQRACCGNSRSVRISAARRSLAQSGQQAHLLTVIAPPTLPPALAATNADVPHIPWSWHRNIFSRNSAIDPRYTLAEGNHFEFIGKEQTRNAIISFTGRDNCGLHGVGRQRRRFRRSNICYTRRDEWAASAVVRHACQLCHTR